MLHEPWSPIPNTWLNNSHPLSQDGFQHWRQSILVTNVSTASIRHWICSCPWLMLTKFVELQAWVEIAESSTQAQPPMLGCIEMMAGGYVNQTRSQSLVSESLYQIPSLTVYPLPLESILSSASYLTQREKTHGKVKHLQYKFVHQTWFINYNFLSL